MDQGGQHWQDLQNDEINYCDGATWTPAQWARSVRGNAPGAREVLRARAEASRPAWTALWAAVAPLAQTQSFKLWFADSVALNEDGKPQVLFLKTTSCRDEFYCCPGRMSEEYGEDFGLGIYCWDAPDTAQIYGEPGETIEGLNSSRVLPVYIHSCNPLVLSKGKELKSLWAQAGGEDAWRAMEPQQKTCFIQDLGYDSVLAHEWDQWVVFKPEQVRLATAENADYAASLVEALLQHLLPASEGL